MENKKLEALVLEMNILKDKAKIYIQHNEYIYTDVYKGWINEYNSLLKKYNAITELQLTQISFSEYELSSTQKTVRKATVDSYSQIQLKQ